MYKRYNLADVQKEVIKLLQNNNPMSSSEISKRMGINRITVSKYLDILYVQKIINKKKIGSVNFWYIDQGISDMDLTDDNYIDLQQKLVMALVSGEKEISQNIMLSIINKRINIKKILIDICFPVLNTLLELHNRGKIGKTEKVHLINTLTETITILKNWIETNADKRKKSSLLVLVAGDDESIPICSMLDIYAQRSRITSILIGNIENYIDPFFDIDFKRYLNKIYNKNKEKINLCIISHNEMSIRFLFSALSESELTQKVKITIFSNKSTKTKMENKFSEIIITDFAALIEAIEKDIG